MRVRLAFLSTVAAVSGLVLSSVGQAATDPGMAVMDVFVQYCMSTDGHPSASSVPLPGPSIAAPMPAEKLAGLQGGRGGGAAWVIKMPAGQLILLHDDPRGVCAVRVDSLPVSGMRSAFDVTLDRFKQLGGAGVVIERKESTLVQGVPALFEVVRVDHKGITSRIGFTSAEAKAGAQQHLLTYSK